jgi:tyrosyl-tRNA synthetase
VKLFDDLAFRGLIYQVTDLDNLEQRLAAGPVTLYNGFDPTADSLTIGNLVPILLLRRFQLAGHIPIGIVGGGTGLIGDPSGKGVERQLNDLALVEEWTGRIRSQVGRFLDFDIKSNPARIISNYSWLSELDLLGFLRDTGKHFPVNYMLAKESVSARLEAGISYTEFSYMLLQAYDFLWLRQNMDCELQTGGSDQWGNITAGVDLIRRVTGLKAYGLTTPLVTTADGAKIGKTALGAVWLDPAKTSPYEFYQYWVNTGDRDVVSMLKIFTFLSHDEIRQLEQEVAANPGLRVAQRTLAEEVTALVHGRAATARAENISKALFYGNVRDLSPAEIEEGLNNVPSFTVAGPHRLDLVDLLAEAGISPSKRRAREDVQNGAIFVNDERVTDTARTLAPEERLAGKYVVIRRGKNKYYLVKWLVDG